MNIIFCFVFIIGIFLMLFQNPHLILDCMINGASNGIELCISLTAIYAIWMGILKVAENCGINKLLEKILKPMIKFLFGNIDSNTASLIAVNLSANILGMGNASTPSGIKAMELLSKNKTKVTKQMSMLVLLNSLSLQILPTTIIGLRIAAGSKNATNIFLPIIIVSHICVTLGVLFLKLFFKEDTK